MLTSYSHAMKAILQLVPGATLQHMPDVQSNHLQQVICPLHTGKPSMYTCPTWVFDLGAGREDQGKDQKDSAEVDNMVGKYLVLEHGRQHSVPDSQASVHEPHATCSDSAASGAGLKAAKRSR